MKKTNNKGFSLVELIIVIAIMVILVAVIAPQYTKFVKNSRISTDVQTAAEMATVIDVAIADGTYTSSMESTYEGKASKLGGTWDITVDAVNGVSKIELTVDTVKYEVYPNALIANLTTDTPAGLRQ